MAEQKKTKAVFEPSIPLVEAKADEADKAELVVFTLKAKRGGAANSPTYKFSLRRFEEGTPAEFITLLKGIIEIWLQNSLDSGSDRLATVRALLRGEALTTFEGAIVASGPNPNANDVNLALEEVKLEVFPHRALEYQKSWMRRRMRKPDNLPFRKMAAAVTKLNDHLPFFPAATDADKFSDYDIVEILEWTIPASWRAKFDLDNYTPTDDSKAVLI